MRFEIRHEPNGTVGLALDGVTILGLTHGDTEEPRDGVIVGMRSADFENLATAMTAGRRRAVDAALDDALTEVQRLTEARDAWKELAARNDADTGPLRSQLRIVQRERDELHRRVEYLTYTAESRTTDDDADELRATIVRQATEITRLTGESE